MQTDKQTWNAAHICAEKMIKEMGLFTSLKVAERLSLNSLELEIKQFYAIAYLIILYEMELLTNENLK